MKPERRNMKTENKVTGVKLDLPFGVPRKSPWRFVGVIARESEAYGRLGITFEELLESAKKIDHGEIREQDVYPEGAICWMKEGEA